MITSNTENKIKSQQKLTRQSKIHNHQELVFGDSKFIFYDSNILEPSMKKISSDNRTSIYKKIKINKANTHFIRPHSTVAKQRSKLMASKLKDKESTNKNKENYKINLVFNQAQPNQDKETQVINQVSLKNAPRLSKSIQNRKSIRPSNKNTSQIPNLNMNSPDKSSNFKSPVNLQKSRLKNQSTHRASEHGDASSRINRKEEQETNFLPQNSKPQNNLQEANRQEIANASDQQSKCLIKLKRHDQIKQIFGQHHKLLKTDRDYLSFMNEDLNSKQMYSCKMLLNSKSEAQQKKLEKQISELKIVSNSPNKDNFSKLQNNSGLSCTSKSVLNTNSFLAQTGIYRAPILLYLKNSQTKKLYNIIIQNSREDQNLNYIDKEFSHEGISTIDGENVEWVYIKPNSNVNLFPPDQDHRLFLIQENSERKQNCDFVTFLKGLYYFEPDLIKRLFEPPVNNLYSVWLFLNGCYQPVFIDGYFTLDSHLNHFYGSSGQFLWLPVLIKCLCKIKNTLSKEQLSHMKLSQIYCMLTGMPLQIIENEQFFHLSSAQLSKLIQKQAEEGSNCMLYSHKFRSIWLAFCNNNHSVTLLNPCTGQRRSLESLDRKSFSIIVIPEFTNQFIYNFRANQSSLSKFEVICPRSTEITFSVGGVLGEKIKNRRLYVYECEGFGRNNGKIKLILREEAEIKNIKKLKFKKGNYKVFIEDGQKKIHLLLTGKNIVKWQQKSVISSQFCISLFASHEVKLSQIEQLEKKGNYLEDSSNIYQDCANRKSQQHA